MKFNNVELQKVHDESYEILQNHKRKMDACSQDIRNLENMLKSGGKSHVVVFEDSSFALFYDNYDKRLKYRSCSIDTPLISCKVELRLKVWSYLGVFLQHYLCGLTQTVDEVNDGE